MEPLLEQQWPKKFVILSTEVPSFAGSWDGVADEVKLRQMFVWGAKHPPAAGLAVPFLSEKPPAIVPGLKARPALAAFVGTVFINQKHGKTVGRSPLRELLVKECEDVANAGHCEVVSDMDNGTEKVTRDQVYGKQGLDRVAVMAAEAYKKSRFAFCPWGDVLSRKSTFDALMQGSIPVFFEGVMADQYMHFGPIKNMSVQIPLSAVKLGGGGALHYLRSLPDDKVEWLHNNVARMRRLFHMPESANDYKPGDAADVIVRKVAAHFKALAFKSLAASHKLPAGSAAPAHIEERVLPDIPTWTETKAERIEERTAERKQRRKERNHRHGNHRLGVEKPEDQKHRMGVEKPEDEDEQDEQDEDDEPDAASIQRDPGLWEKEHFIGVENPTTEAEAVSSTSEAAEASSTSKAAAMRTGLLGPPPMIDPALALQSKARLTPVVRMQRQAGLLHSAKIRSATLDGGIKAHQKSKTPLTNAAVAEVQKPNKSIGLYRIIGNALPPRHDKDQLLRSLTFMLENEPPLPGAEKVYLLNRLHNATEAKMAKDLITWYGHKWIEDPLVASDYHSYQQQITFGLPVTKFQRRGWGGIINRANNVARLDSNLFLMNNNGARNLAISDGLERGFTWVLPFDGNSFFTTARWQQLRDGLIQATQEDKTYVTLPLIRTVSNRAAGENDQLWVLPNDPEPGEPQIGFHKNSVLRFNPTIPYGHRPKVELLWRLGVKGEWDNYQCAPYEIAHACEHGAACSCGVHADVEEANKCLALGGKDGRVGVLRLPDIAEETRELEEAAVAVSLRKAEAAVDQKHFDPSLASGEGKKARHERGQMRDEGVKLYIDRFDAETRSNSRRGAPTKPLFFNLAAMEHVRRSWLVGVRDRATAQVDNLLNHAKANLDLPPPSLADKTTNLHPEANKRHYQSVALYDWQVKELSPAQLKAAYKSHDWTEEDHPLKPDDWITWEGHPRPGGLQGAGDRSRVEYFHGNLTLFALASFYTNEDAYTEKAVELARHWWLSEETGMLPTMKYAQANRPEDQRYAGVIEMRSIATALDAMHLIQGTPAWQPEDAEKLRTWCHKYGSFLEHSPERHTKNSHRWWWGVQFAAVQYCAGDRIYKVLQETAKGAAGAVDGKTGIIPAEKTRSRSVHYHILAAHAAMMLWRASENQGFTESATSLKGKLIATFRLLAQGAQGILKDADEFTRSQLSARISLLCQWSDDTIGWTSTLTKEACTPKMQPDDYMHSGAIPFATLVF